MTSHVASPDVSALESIAGLLAQQTSLCESAISVATDEAVKRAALAWRLESREMLRQVKAELDSSEVPAAPEIDLMLAVDKASMRVRAAFGGPNQAALGALMRGRARLCRALGKRMSDGMLRRKTRAFLRRLAAPIGLCGAHRPLKRRA